MGFNAHPRIDRDAAVLVGQHLFGVSLLQQAPSDEGTQDAFLQGGLHLGHAIRIDCTGRVEDDTRRWGLNIGIGIDINVALAHHRLKHPIDHTNMEVHMLVQAGAKAVDEGDCANVQGRIVYLRRPWAAGLQALRDDPQENTQHHVEHWPVALHEVAQALWHGQHPLAHRQAGEDVVREVRRRPHHASCVA